MANAHPPAAVVRHPAEDSRVRALLWRVPLRGCHPGIGGHLCWEQFTDQTPASLWVEQQGGEASDETNPRGVVGVRTPWRRDEREIGHSRLRTGAKAVIQHPPGGTGKGALRRKLAGGLLLGVG